MEHLRKLRIPTLVIAGGKDVLISPLHSLVFARALEAEFLFFSDAGHGVNDHKLNKVHRAMERLFKRRVFDKNRAPAMPGTHPWFIVLMALALSVSMHNRLGVSKSASFGTFALISAITAMRNGGPWLM